MELISQPIIINIINTSLSLVESRKMRFWMFVSRHARAYVGRDKFIWFFFFFNHPQIFASALYIYTYVCAYINHKDIVLSSCCVRNQSVLVAASTRCTYGSGDFIGLVCCLALGVGSWLLAVGNGGADKLFLLKCLNMTTEKNVAKKHRKMKRIACYRLTTSADICTDYQLSFVISHRMPTVALSTYGGCGIDACANHRFY